MNNKRGGFGAKLLLVLILMIASAVGGAYGYRVFDGKLAIRDAKRVVDRVDVSDYDTPEGTIIQGYIDDTLKDLETAASRKEVYEIVDDFKSDVSKVMTKTEKELEEARKAANSSNNNNNYNNGNNSGNYNNDYNNNNSNNNNGNYDNNNNSNNYNSGSNDNSQNNSSSSSSENKSSGGILGKIIGGSDDDVNDNGSDDIFN